METKQKETNELEGKFLFLVNNCFLFIHVGFYLYLQILAFIL